MISERRPSEPLPPLRPVPLDVKIVRALTLGLLGLTIPVVLLLEMGKAGSYAPLALLTLFSAPPVIAIPLVAAGSIAVRRPWRREVHVAPLFLVQVPLVVWAEHARWQPDSRWPLILVLGFAVSWIALLAAAIIARRGWRIG